MPEPTVKEICALAAIIPETIDTEYTHLCILCEERYAIAKAILEKYTITKKENETDEPK
jgi:hypothetical protein